MAVPRLSNAPQDFTPEQQRKWNELVRIVEAVRQELAQITVRLEALEAP